MLVPAQNGAITHGINEKQMMKQLCF